MWYNNNVIRGVGTPSPNKRKEVIEMKRFKVVAKGTVMDVEINLRTMFEAYEVFDEIRDSGSYNKVYVMDNETGEIYRTFDISMQAGGMMVQEWYTLG